MELVFGLLNLAVLAGFGILLRREVAEDQRAAAAGEGRVDSGRKLLVFKVGLFVVSAALIAALIWWSPETRSPAFVALGIVALALLFLDQRRRGL